MSKSPMRFVLILIFFTACNKTKNSAKTKSLGFQSAQLSCEELHLQFHYDYEYTRNLWSEFQGSDSVCNKKLSTIIDSNIDSRIKLPDLLSLQDLKALITTQAIFQTKNTMSPIAAPLPKIGKGIASVASGSKWRRVFRSLARSPSCSTGSGARYSGALLAKKVSISLE